VRHKQVRELVAIFPGTGTGGSANGIDGAVGLAQQPESGMARWNKQHIGLAVTMMVWW